MGDQWGRSLWLMVYSVLHHRCNKTDTQADWQDRVTYDSKRDVHKYYQ